MRVASLLPSATEIIAAVGAGDALCAVSHECDHPASVVAGLPRLSLARIDPGLPSLAIDEAVRAARGRGEALYALRAADLAAARPDLIVTQTLCTVCAIDGDTVTAAASAAGVAPRVVELEPQRLADVLASVTLLGAELGAPEAAARLRTTLEARLDALVAATAPLAPVPVVVLEWLDPPFSAGHWVPEVVAAAGGRELLGRAGAPSSVTDWCTIAEAAPDVVVVAPCGLSLERALAEAERIGVAARLPPGTRLIALDGNALLSRPAPRLVDAAEILGSVLHPAAVSRPPTAAAYLHAGPRRFATSPQGRAVAMERTTDKHSPRLDEEMKRETASLTHGAPVDARADEFREQEAPTDYEPGASSRLMHLDPQGNDPAGARREFSRHLLPSMFPGDRDSLLDAANAEDAPGPVIDLLAQLPPGQQFATMYEVWGALGGDTVDVPSEVAHRAGAVDRDSPHIQDDVAPPGFQPPSGS